MKKLLLLLLPLLVACTMSTSTANLAARPHQDVPTPLPTATPQVQGKVNVSALTVRTGPGVEYPAIGWLTTGQRVIIQAKSNGWGQITSTESELEGWVNLHFLDLLPYDEVTK